MMEDMDVVVGMEGVVEVMGEAVAVTGEVAEVMVVVEVGMGDGGEIAGWTEMSTWLYFALILSVHLAMALGWWK